MHLKSILLILFCTGVAAAGNLYNIHITTLEGLDKPMSDFQGKKLLVIVLPVSTNASDSQYLRKVDSVSRTYQDSVNILGVPGFEYGFQDADTASLRQYYRSILGDQVILAGGCYVKKSSGELQHPLFSWLTHSDQNEQFDLDVRGIGQKYFISGNGELYGNLSAAVTLRDSLMIKMLY